MIEMYLYCLCSFVAITVFFIELYDIGNTTTAFYKLQYYVILCG